MKTGLLIFFLLLTGLSIYLMIEIHWAWVVLLLISIIFLFIWSYDHLQKHYAIHRNFPIIGRFRDIAGWMRPKIYQYFVESDTEGRPFDKTLRDVVFHRASMAEDTSPFGTQLDLYQEGYEWMNHSIAPIDLNRIEAHPKILVGGPHTKQKYQLSLLNISAMSYGSLSANAIAALNGGAAIGGFAHNTGEGGISPYHLQYNGDLIYQIGTGYFGCRAKDGNFSPELFAERTSFPQVKMIELKLSQGAKPGHGGILPAAKVTPEISAIRHVEMGKDVLSPPYHKAFSTPVELLEFVQRMRELSDGKPIGIKLCVGHKAEFLSVCKAMLKTGIQPDFITVDGGEGGTGAAPLEFANSVGMPYKEGLAFVYNALVGFDLKENIKIIASGKIATGFHIFRSLALGADACGSARAMMISLGCIQALECNRNTCPTGVATQDPKLTRGLVIEDKRYKVSNFHRQTIASFIELMSAAGLDHPDKINRSHIYRRISQRETMRFDHIYPYIKKGSLLQTDTIPTDWKFHIGLSSAEQFMIHQPLEYLHE
ncbi:MAG TPA: FMN-binding glutamate synthase family protein [Saprospiraceae bacterium]|nr:FMN-binding glutamate synthase family protein [Saprospiraceae bacterium]